MIPTVYCDTYHAETPTQSMKKLRPVARGAERLGLAQLHPPAEADIVGKLKALHCPDYVDQFISGVEPLAGSQGWSWTSQIRDGVLAINRGQLTAAALALKHGLAANVAQGFHHAGRLRGSGYCTFNGLALVAREYPRMKVAVLDCDEHGGNGTEEFISLLDNLFQVTIHGSTFGCRGSERSILRTLPPVTHDFGIYERALENAVELIADWQPDLLLYQAGADPHIDDPLNTLGMTDGQLRAPDRFVFEFCRGSKLPVMFVLAGGYQAMDDLVRLHLQTFEEARAVYAGRHPQGGEVLPT